MDIEKIGLEIAKETVKEVATDVYEDAGRPIAKPTGELIGLIPRAIKAALSPLEKWVMQREYNIAETQKLLELKLQNVCPELIEPPEPHIAIPAIQYISYCMDNEDLRNLYANLLASAMQKDIKDNVHPAYVEIIKQLCPDEAKILKYLYIHNTIPTVDIKCTLWNGETSFWRNDFTAIAELAECQFPRNGNRYFENLTRLGLVEKSKNEWFFNQDRYDLIFNHPNFKKQYEFFNKPPAATNVECIKGVYEITEFCQSFFSVCLYDPSDDSEGDE